MSNEFVQMTVTCSVCGKVRGEANHYFRFYPPTAEEKTILIVRLGDSYQGSTLWQPACGAGCVTVLVSRSLEGL